MARFNRSVSRSTMKVIGGSSHPGEQGFENRVKNDRGPWPSWKVSKEGSYNYSQKCCDRFGFVTIEFYT